MNKTVAIHAVFSLKPRSVFDRFKLSVEKTFLGYVSDPEHESNLWRLFVVLQSGHTASIRAAVSDYLPPLPGRYENSAMRAYRIPLFTEFVDSIVKNEQESVALKFLFFKEAWRIIRSWGVMELPSPARLGLCHGFLTRGRERDTLSGKDHAVVGMSHGKLVANNNRLGKGAFGSIKTGVLTRDNGINEIVAIKRIPLDRPTSGVYPSLLDAIDEALLPYRLGAHPNIMPVYDFYVYDDGKKTKNVDSKTREAGTCPKFGIVMPKAACVGDAILSKRLKDGVSVLRDAALALAHMEMMNYMHNDFKLPNIFIFEDGSVKLGDFGISYPRGEEPRDNTLGGTYPSPEAVETRILKYAGVDFSKIDTFAFGVVLYELLYYKTHPDFVLKSGRSALYIADFSNGHLCDREVFDKDLQESVLTPANPVVGFLETARTFCDALKERSKSAKNRFVPSLADLVGDCLASDPGQRPSMRIVVSRLMGIQSLLLPDGEAAPIPKYTPR